VGGGGVLAVVGAFHVLSLVIAVLDVLGGD
jgi:hypothetical protein